MDELSIVGHRPLAGRVAISGSKNATLPVMAACLLTDQPLELTNVPDIEDVETMADMLRSLGVAAEKTSPSSWRLHAERVTSTSVGAERTQRIRGSFLLLGALVARAGEAAIARPGGDDIGMRRVEQHIEGMRLMGAEVSEQDDAYVARAHRLRGARIDLDMPTVTGTENLVMAAVLADGITVINNAAREPHVYDLARCLIGMGARLQGVGSETIVVEGCNGLLHGTQHSVTTDYIEAGTYMVAAAATAGDITVERMRPTDVRFLTEKLRRAGCEVVEGPSWTRVRRRGELLAVDMTTWPHPGFATDLQAQYVALMTQARGTSIVSEAIFENRFRHVEELCRLGAVVRVEGRSAVVEGPARLTGTSVAIPDIRSGAALVVAALCAEGETVLSGVYHLDRGYEAMESKLALLGAELRRTVAGSPVRRDLSGVVGD